MGLLIFLDVKRYLNQTFVKTGKLVFFNNDPALDVNRYLGHLLLLIWELCDVLTLMKIPHNPFWPTDVQPWTFSDFNVTNKVSLFRVLASCFPLLPLKLGYLLIYSSDSGISLGKLHSLFLL